MTHDQAWGSVLIVAALLLFIVLTVRHEVAERRGRR